MKAQIELTLRIGQYGERAETIVLQISEDVARDLTEPMERSNDPFSILLASPGMYGGRGNAVTMRRKTFKLRREAARDIAREVERKLIEMFGVDDKLDGYHMKDLSPEEIAYHERRGRIERA